MRTLKREQIEKISCGYIMSVCAQDLNRPLFSLLHFMVHLHPVTSVKLSHTRAKASESPIPRVWILQESNLQKQGVVSHTLENKTRKCS